MNAVALLAAAAAWSSPQTISAPHNFAGPLYASSGLAAWNWQDGVGQNAKTGAGLVTVTGGAVSAEQRALDGLVAAQPYGDGRFVELANKQVDTRGRRWQVSVRDGATTTRLATAFVLFRPQLSVAPDGSAIAAWVELHGRRQIVRASTRNGPGRFSKPFTLSGRGQTTVLAYAAGPNGSFLVAFVRNGKLLARLHRANGRWGSAHLLQRAQGKTHWQLTAAMRGTGTGDLVWVRHRFTSPGHPGVRELFAVALRHAFSKVQQLERDNASGVGLFAGVNWPYLAYQSGPNSGAVARMRVPDGSGHYGAPIDAAPPQGGLRSVSLAVDRQGGLVLGWVIPNPSGDGGGIGYAAATGPSGSTFGPREQVTPNEATFDMRLVRESDGVRAFWTARPEGTGPSVPVSQVKTVVRTALRSE